MCGEPVTIARGAGPEEIERTRAELEEELNRITREADELAAGPGRA